MQKLREFFSAIFFFSLNFINITHFAREGLLSRNEKTPFSVKIAASTTGEYPTPSSFPSLQHTCEVCSSLPHRTTLQFLYPKSETVTQSRAIKRVGGRKEMEIAEQKYMYRQSGGERSTKNGSTYTNIDPLSRSVLFGVTNTLATCDN